VEIISSREQQTGGFIISIPGVGWVNWPNVETVREALRIVGLMKAQNRLIGKMKLRVEGENEQ